MEKINPRRIRTFNAFRIFLYFKDNIAFTLADAMNFLEFGYCDAFGPEHYNTESFRKSFRKNINALEEALEKLKLPYGLTKEYLSLVPTNQSNLYRIYKRDEQINFIDFDIEEDDFDVISEYIPFYIYNALSKNSFMTIEMLTNLLNIGKSAIYALIDKINLDLEQCVTNQRIILEHGKLHIIKEETPQSYF